MDEFDPAEEAGRCLRCNCSKCYDVCPLMQTDGRYPKEDVQNIVTTLKPNAATRRPAVRMIANCTFCGKCKEVCPEHIDMGVCLKSARTATSLQTVILPWRFDYWIQDLDFCLSGILTSYGHPNLGEKSDVVFFSGMSAERLIAGSCPTRI